MVSEIQVIRNESSMWFNTGMDIVRVIPLAAMPANAPAVLDYFWATPLPQGCLVRITMGRRPLIALVVESLDVRTAKLALKKSAFALKKLDSVVTETPQISTTQLSLARWMSTHYGASLATCMKTVAPSFLGKRGILLQLPTADAPVKTVPPAGRLVLTQPDTTVAEIKRIASQTKGQLCIIVPEVSLALCLCEKLSVLKPQPVHSGMSARQYETIYRAVTDGSARVIIGTRVALFLPWSAVEHIIVEDPLNEAYKSEMTPRYNAPDAARQLAGLVDASLTWLTPAISAVHHHLISTGTMTREDKKPYWPRVVQISMEQEQLDGSRSLFSRHATEAILDSHDSGKPLLVLSARRGYTTVARCGNCKKTLPCATCSIPMRWHRTTEEMLVCYHCAAFMQIPKQCPSCHGGALRPAGLPGSQKLAEAINAVLDRYGHRKLNIPVLDSDLVRSESGEKEMLEKLDGMEHPILVASQMIFSHRYGRTFDTVIVPQLDALAYNPDYRTQERLIMQLEKIADMRPRHLVVQSWQDTDSLGDIASRQWDAFYRSELAQRKALVWPPFARIVKLSFRHRDRATATRQAAVAVDRMRRAIEHLGARGTRLLGPGPALVERAGGQWTQNIIIKSTLSGLKLSELLSYVPDRWTVDVDPRSIT
ncbi:MAG: primosomal protein N' [Patescibacteria group bacterium]